MTTTRGHGAARTVVGVFTDRSPARDAAHELHDAGYKHTWIGTTRPHDPTGTPPGTLTGEIDGTDVIEGGGGNIAGRIGRFFAGSDYTLFEALREHGVPDADAAQLEESIPPGSSVLTLTLGSDERADSPDPRTIIHDCGGRLLTSISGPVTGEQRLERDEIAQSKGIAASREREEIATFNEEFFTERREPR